MDESLIKLSRVPDRVPSVNDLSGFKFAWNTRDGKFFGLKDNGDGTFAIVSFGGGGLSEAETDPVFQEWLSTFVAAVEKSYLSLTDTPDSNAGKAKNVPIVNDAETGHEYIPTKLANSKDLSDFPQTLVGQALKVLRAKADETGYELIANNFLTAITKAMIEAVLTGSITSHTHDYLPTSVKQEIEINDTWKLGNNLYVENVFTGSDLTQVNYWSTSAKTLKLFTKDITYTSGNPTSIVLKDEVTGKLLTTTIAYTGSDVLNITKVVS